MARANLYDFETYQHALARIERLTADSKPQWGRMDAAQMLAHCAEIVEVTNGKPLENTPLVARLFKGMIRKMVVGEKPYPKGTRTHPQYLQTSDRDFAKEMARLLAALDRFKQREGAETEHSMFGVMTREEKGWSMYKHLDHHLRQFGV